MSSNPFLPPRQREPAPGYGSTRVLTVLVVSILALDAVLLIVNGVCVALLAVLDPGVLKQSEPRDPLSALLSVAVFLSSAFYLLAYGVGGFLFLFWLARANQNARALGSKNMEFTPGWMVGWFFVPIFNLFKPYEAVDELYLASDPTSGEDQWGASDPPRFILAWWLSWLFFGIGGSLAHFLGGQTAWALVPNFAGPLAAALAIAVVLSIDRRQTEKRKRIGTLSSFNESPSSTPRKFSL